MEKHIAEEEEKFEVKSSHSRRSHRDKPKSRHEEKRESLLKIKRKFNLIANEFYDLKHEQDLEHHELRKLMRSSEGLQRRVSQNLQKCKQVIQTATATKPSENMIPEQDTITKEQVTLPTISHQASYSSPDKVNKNEGNIKVGKQPEKNTLFIEESQQKIPPSPITRDKSSRLLVKSPLKLNLLSTNENRSPMKPAADLIISPRRKTQTPQSPRQFLQKANLVPYIASITIAMVLSLIFFR